MKIKSVFILAMIFLPGMLTSLGALDPQETGLVAPGYKMIGWTAGDLNKDGQEDLVAVLEKNGGTEEELRILQIFLGSKDGAYTKALEASNALLLSREGGIMGDPFESINIKRDSLFLSFSGGSRERWSAVFQFQFRNNGWYLIGRESSTYDTLTQDSTSSSTNYVSGRKQKIGEMSGEPKVESWSNFPKAPLVPLQDFGASDEQWWQ